MIYQQLNLNKQNKWTSRTETDSQKQRTFWCLPDGSGVERIGRKGEGIKKYKLVATEQSQGCKVQHREYSQLYSNNYVWYQVDFAIY